MVWLLTGGALPIFLIFSGAFFIIYLKGYPFRAPRKMCKALQAEKSTDGISPFRAVMQALAGTLGVGNIVGVANAIAIGGAGAIFWMWISALFAMILKYAEILLAVSHRRVARDKSCYGGAAYYIKDFFVGRGRLRAAVIVPSVFVILMLADALGMGCAIQVSAVTGAIQGVCALPTWSIVLVLCVLTVPLLARGTRGLSALTEYLVPIMSAGYLLLSAAVLFLRRDALGEALVSIFREALCVNGISGGIVGFLTSRALRVGTMRGVLSNEAGCGTAPTAHASACAKSPATQGVWGIFEVFADTIVLCTATALVILVGGGDAAPYAESGVQLAIRAYGTVLGEGAEYFFAAAIFCFGYATLLCWGGYGLESVRFLSPKKRYRVAYLLAVTVCIAYGARGESTLVWAVSDFAMTALTTVNLSILLMMRREIRTETEREFILELSSQKSGAVPFSAEQNTRKESL